MATTTALPSFLLLCLPNKPYRNHHHRHQSLLLPPSTSTATVSVLSPTRPKPSNPLTYSIPLNPNPHPQIHPTYPSQTVSNLNSDTENLDSFSDNYHHLLRLSIHHHDYSLARAIHASILKLQEEIDLLNTLIVVYIKLGKLTDARNLFSSLSSPNVVSYTSLISAYANSNREKEAIRLFFAMRSSGIQPNSFSFVAILTACVRILNSKLGFQVHSLIIKMGYCSYVYVSNALMSGYLKWGSVNSAIQVFDELPQRDLASWNTVIAGLVKDSQYQKAFERFRDLQKSDRFCVDHFTISSLLTASKESYSLREGQEIHAHAIKIGFASNVSVNNALIGFYTNCGSAKDVTSIFKKMPVRDVISWTGMVTGCMEFGLVESAMKVFNQMPTRNCISYNALLAGFCKNGEGLRALEMFRGMLENSMEVSDFTLSSIITACSVITDVKVSKQIHGFVVKCGCGSNNAWIEAALIDMCMKCGRTSDAQKLFIKWLCKHNESMVWTSMICGYARNGQHNEAMSLFCEMQADGGVRVDEVASTAALTVCGSLGSYDMGKQIHCYALKSGFQYDLHVGNATVAMYFKCGNMEDAVKFFDLMPKHDIVSWNGLISGYVLHRNGDKALYVWSNMKEMGIKPDSLTFMLLLSAFKYTNSNLLDYCRELFMSMQSLYGIEPTSEHYASMISVLGYWGCFDEAEEMINNMNIESDALVWRALLDSCRLRSNTNLGRFAAKHLLAIEPKDPASFILVSNLYSASGRWHCSEKIREEMRLKGLKKNPAQSWIIHQNKIHTFFTRDKSHPSTKDIYSGLDILILESIKAGYVPDTSFVLHEVEEHQKKEFLFYHSAKLAATYGLLTTKVGKPIRVVKNIHLCGDCHTFFKHVSSITKREIYLRDVSGFHHFKNGECSCRDYW
ncbi:hypothetical protein MKW98_026324 [Papaver atlanticum]|uniref:DYW domain-containing protein n=1 Tax=Papaver atlanticum TaxID=357466 RepID=A0AAD4SQB0_9MAGN|nr:hypothetical protein MKW98_026324 [Papaver atlanticum]